MNALAVLAEARELGIVVEAAGDKIKARRRSGVPPSFVEKLRAHKPELLRVLTIADADVPARARQRLIASCEKMRIDPEPILRQFNAWKVTADDMREMLHWTDDTVRRHVELLAGEIETGMRP